MPGGPRMPARWATAQHAGIELAPVAADDVREMARRDVIMPAAYRVLMHVELIERIRAGVLGQLARPLSYGP